MQNEFSGKTAFVPGAAALPIGRISEPEEQAEKVLFLCSDKASYMIGHAFVADGGHGVI